MLCSFQKLFKFSLQLEYFYDFSSKAANLYSIDLVVDKESLRNELVQEQGNSQPNDAVSIPFSAMKAAWIFIQRLNRRYYNLIFPKSTVSI